MNHFGSVLLIILGSYLLGCLQWSYLLVRYIKKQDIRKLGHGNAGASNTVINFGWKFGALVALLDVAKAVCAVILARAVMTIVGLEALDTTLILASAGVAVVLGHVFPFFMNFKGGKGTASAVGMMLAIDWRIGLLGIAALLILTLISNYIAIGAIGMWATYIAGAIFWLESDLTVALLTIILVLSIWLHRENISRILQGTETGLRKTMKKHH